MSAPASTKTCGDCYHREALLASEFAACIHCFAIYPPADITLWTARVVPAGLRAKL